VLQAAPALQGFDGDAVVLYADTPFLTPETLDRLRAARADHDVVVLGFDAEDPGATGGW
jgi:bifunctional UDP-N-acetylglucosamine pyrophosphorylase/glucosamine-1-phosphate N-acetyltransferase